MRISANLLLLISATLATVFAAPIILRDRTSITKNTFNRNLQPVFDENFVAEHDHVEKKLNQYGLRDVYPRANPQRADHKLDKASKKNMRVLKALENGRGKKDKRPSNAKITFSDGARKRLDELGLKGKERKKVKAYHKKIVKQNMQEHGADSAKIFHLEHKGGSKPNEPSHITAAYYRAPENGHPGTTIISPYAQRLMENHPGARAKGLFHVYTKDQARKTSVPSVWQHALDAADARKAAEIAKAKAPAQAAKAQRAAQEVLAGQSLTQEEKQAQRQAAKAAKNAAKRKQ